MRIYIVEDDLSVINILEDIIETQGLGEICGDCGGEPANLSDVLRAKPDGKGRRRICKGAAGCDHHGQMYYDFPGVRQRADQQGLQRRDRLLYQQADQPDRGPFRIKKCGTADHK